jgi:hypothetical protein
MAETDQKEQIQHAIVRARDGVGDRIDELDRHLRSTLDPKVIVRSYAPHLVAGGAVLGIIVGFALPKVFRKLITWGVPIAILAVAIKNARNGEQVND